MEGLLVSRWRCDYRLPDFALHSGAALLWIRQLSGAVVSTPEGRGVILAKVVDATGTDAAVAAGAAYRYGTINRVTLRYRVPDSPPALRERF